MKNDFVWHWFSSVISLPTVFKQLSPDWQSLVKQASGCMASAWARLAASVGEVEATRFLENEWGQEIPKEVIEAGLLKKARFAHVS